MGNKITRRKLDNKPRSNVSTQTDEPFFEDKATQTIQEVDTLNNEIQDPDIFFRLCLTLVSEKFWSNKKREYNILKENLKFKPTLSVIQETEEDIFNEDPLEQPHIPNPPEQETAKSFWKDYFMKVKSNKSTSFAGNLEENSILNTNEQSGENTFPSYKKYLPKVPPKYFIPFYKEKPLFDKYSNHLEIMDSPERVQDFREEVNAILKLKQQTTLPPMFKEKNIINTMEASEGETYPSYKTNISKMIKKPCFSFFKEKHLYDKDSNLTDIPDPSAVIQDFREEVYKKIKSNQPPNHSSTHEENDKHYTKENLGGEIYPTYETSVEAIQKNSAPLPTQASEGTDLYENDPKPGYSKNQLNPLSYIESKLKVKDTAFFGQHFSNLKKIFLKSVDDIKSKETSNQLNIPTVIEQDSLSRSVPKTEEQTIEKETSKELPFHANSKSELDHDISNRKFSGKFRNFKIPFLKR